MEAEGLHQCNSSRVCATISTMFSQEIFHFSFLDLLPIPFHSAISFNLLAEQFPSHVVVLHGIRNINQSRPVHAKLPMIKINSKTSILLRAHHVSINLRTNRCTVFQKIFLVYMYMFPYILLFFFLGKLSPKKGINFIQ